jgi:uncharacterized protein YkwD/uncharacterized membrane protein required for colicin V production
MNYVDLVIVVVILLLTYLGYLRGFIRDFLDLVALVLAIWVASATYISFGAYFAQVLPITTGIATTAAFFFVWFVVMLVYYGLMTFFYDRVPEGVRESKYNKWFGLLPAFVRAVLFVWFTINLLVILSIFGPIQKSLDGSYFAGILTKNNGLVSSFISRTFGPAAADTAQFLTVKPQSNENIALGFSTTNVKSDPTAAKQMLVLLNNERKAAGLPELVFDEKLAQVGEAHCKDMFARGYFSHNTPEGKTPFDRMDAAGITYFLAGENLALAPSVDDAFTGLMNSPGHKANMLTRDFGKVGISAVDGGKYGIMLAQEFTN